MLQDCFDLCMFDVVVVLVDSVYCIDLYGFGSLGVVVFDVQMKFFCYGIFVNVYSDLYFVLMLLNVLQVCDVVIVIFKLGVLFELQMVVECVCELGVCVIVVIVLDSLFVVFVDVVLFVDVDDVVVDCLMVVCLLYLVLFDVLVLEVVLCKGSVFYYVD